MSWMGSFSLNEITNPYFILFIGPLPWFVFEWLINVVVERTFKMHVAVFKKTM